MLDLSSTFVYAIYQGMSGLLERDWDQLDALVRVWWLASTQMHLLLKLALWGFHILRRVPSVFFKKIPKDVALWDLFILELLKTVSCFCGGYLDWWTNLLLSTKCKLVRGHPDNIGLDWISPIWRRKMNYDIYWKSLKGLRWSMLIVMLCPCRCLDIDCFLFNGFKVYKLRVRGFRCRITMDECKRKPLSICYWFPWSSPSKFV